MDIMLRILNVLAYWLQRITTGNKNNESRISQLELEVESLRSELTDTRKMFSSTLAELKAAREEAELIQKKLADAEEKLQLYQDTSLLDME